jgi:DTW domain-containing protein YfiP
MVTTSTKQPRSSNNSKKERRLLCVRCQRPAPQTCLCTALPTEPIPLQQCQCIVLQHPHELARKNRSVPLLTLCLHPSSMHLTVGRRFGSTTNEFLRSVWPWSTVVSEDQHTTKNTMNTNESNETTNSEQDDNCNRQVWLLFPDPHAMSLSQAMAQRQNAHITLIVLDATWKHAKEMHQANVEHDLYPHPLRLVQLGPNDVVAPRCRFDIRTPPSPAHLSTTEALAWVVSQLEHSNDSLYNELMKPLDLMVSQWHSFTTKPLQRQKLSRKRPLDTLQEPLSTPNVPI